MIITFSHVVDGNRVPLLDAYGREITLSVTAADRTSAMNSVEVENYCATQTGDCRVREVRP